MSEAASTAHVAASIISKSCVIFAVLPNIMDAEQYFSADSLMALSTRLGSSFFAADPEMHMDAGKHLGFGIGAFGVKLGHTIGDLLATFFQYVHYIESGAAAHANQHQLHRPTAAILATVLRRSVHRDRVAAVGATFETSLSNPVNPGLHNVLR